MAWKSVKLNPLEQWAQRLEGALGYMIPLASFWATWISDHIISEDQLDVILTLALGKDDRYGSGWQAIRTYFEQKIYEEKEEKRAYKSARKRSKSYFESEDFADYEAEMVIEMCQFLLGSADALNLRS